MKNHYLIALEREVDRLWLGQEKMMVVSLGKDKYIMSDGARSVRGKGHALLKVSKSLPDRAGTVRFWKAMEPLGVNVYKNINIEIDPTN